MPDGGLVDDIERYPGPCSIGLGFEAHDGGAAAVERDGREGDAVAHIAPDSVAHYGLLTYCTAIDGR